ncbi:MAG: hypothetical protein ACOVQU_12800, partial [Exiguobacterium acetylicum]
MSNTKPSIKSKKPAASLPPSSSSSSPLQLMHHQEEQHGDADHDSSSDDAGSIESVDDSESVVADTVIAPNPSDPTQHAQSVNAIDEATAQAAIHGLLSANSTGSNNINYNNPSAVNTELILRLLEKMTLQGQPAPKRRLRLKDEERRLAIEPNKLNRNAELFEFKQWEQNLRTKTDTKQIFTKLLFTEPVNSWSAFKRAYTDLVEPDDMEEEYLQFHRNLFAWLDKALDPDLSRNVTIHLKSKPAESNLTRLLGFAFDDPDFFQNCHATLEWLRGRSTPSTPFTLSQLLVQASSHFYDAKKWPNPIDWISDLNMIHMNIKLVNKQFHIPSDDELPMILIPLIRVEEVQNYLITQKTYPTLTELKTFLCNWRAKVEREEKEKKPAFTRRTKETANPVIAQGGNQQQQTATAGTGTGTSDGGRRRKKICSYHISADGCKKGDNCDWAHENISLGALEMENESAHYTASGSNNDIRAHDVIMDSGASNHFTGLKSMLKGVETIDPVMVKTVAGLRKVTEIGELQLTHAVSLKNVRHVEGNPFTLMSLAPIVDNAGKAVVFFKDRAITVDAAIMEHLVKKHEKESLFSFVRKGKLWVFPLKNAPSSESGVEVNMKSKSAQPNSKDQSQSAPPPPAAKGSSSNKKEVKFKPGQGKTKNSKRQSAPGGVKRRSASAAAVSDQQDESE